MLPEGFEWIPRHQYANGELALVLGRMTVAQLLQRIDGSWMARLCPYAEPMSPWIQRSCRSFESGKAGAEAWARRHETALRAEAARIPRPRIAGMPPPAPAPEAGAGEVGPVGPAQ